MIIDEILVLALDLRIDPTPPPGMRFGYQRSYAGYLTDLIEKALDLKPQGPLGERVRRAIALAYLAVVS